MVLAHLLKFSITEKVRAAVADMRDVPGVALDHYRREGRAHARLCGVLLGACIHRGVGRFGRLQKWEALADARLRSIGSDTAGHLTGLGSPHPVADGEQRRRHDEGVLVDLAV